MSLTTLSPRQAEPDAEQLDGGATGCAAPGLAAPQQCDVEVAEQSKGASSTADEQDGTRKRRLEDDIVGGVTHCARGPISNRLRRRHVPTEDVLSVLRMPTQRFDGAMRRAQLPDHVYVLVHSIDGPAFRSDASLGLLASLATIPQVHLVASSSHMRTSLLWDANKSRQFNWAWAEVNTRAHYAAESNDSMHELLTRLQDAAHSSQGLSADLVLEALTSNAKTCFRILVRHQLDNPASVGLSLREWFSICRHEWSVTNEANLTSYIKEYMDHNMLKKRPGPGGIECHYCTLPKELMTRLARAAHPGSLCAAT